MTSKSVAIKLRPSILSPLVGLHQKTNNLTNSLEKKHFRILEDNRHRDICPTKQEKHNFFENKRNMMYVNDSTSTIKQAIVFKNKKGFFFKYYN